MPARTDELSAREAEVLAALADRLTNAEIAAQLYISVRTVESHVSALLRKLGASDRRALAAIARTRTDELSRAEDVGSASFVGRKDELRQLGELLNGNRLVTVIGPGGAGKTRLVEEYAARSRDRFPDGVAFVRLASVTDGSLVVPAVAGTFGVTSDEADGDTLDAVAEYLAARHALVVLDNCEHVVGTAAELAKKLVGNAGRVVVLATSRETLRLRAERVMALQPFAIPEPGAPADVVDTSPAIELFVERARAADPSFGLTSDNRAVVREVCVAVDGLALALELAAARVAEVSLVELARSLKTSLALLDGGARDADDRHQGMAATIAWSHRLLSAGERALFERLSVFAGAFSLGAAEAVCAFPPLSAAEVTGGVARLVAKSLVVRFGDRYRLLEPVRQFAADRLAAGSARAAAAGRHLSHYVSAAERAGIGFTTAGTPSLLADLRANDSNTRAALAWAFDSRADLDGLGTRLVASTTWRWFIDGMLDEGRAWCQRALDATIDASDVELRLRALYACSAMTLAQGDMTMSACLAEEALRLASGPQHKIFRAFMVDVRGVVQWALGELEAAESDLQASASMARDLGLHWHEAFALAELARVVFDAGDRARAAELSAAAVAIAQDAGECMPLGFALDVVAQQRFAEGAVDDAEATAEESLGHYRRLGYREGVASATQLLARTALARRDIPSAHERVGDVIALHRQLGHRGGLAAALATHAQLCAVLRDHESAAVLLGAAERLRNAAGMTVAPSERPALHALRQELETRLGASYGPTARRGAVLGIDEVITFVNDWSPKPRPSKN